MAVNYGTSIATDGLLYCMDFVNPRCYPGSGTTFTNLGSVPTTSTIYNATYYTISNGTIQFTRSATATKDGSVLRSSVLTGTPLAASSFFYNDHTWEITFRIDDVTPGNYDATEGSSILGVYTGYHAGFMYTGTSMNYYVWTTGPSITSVSSWTVGTSGAQINQGRWYTIALTRSGNVWTPYVNGSQLGTGSTTAVSSPGVTSNYVNFGAAYQAAAGAGTYVNYAKNTVSGSKMYGRALSASEIAGNFNAYRGRYGI